MNRPHPRPLSERPAPESAGRRGETASILKRSWLLPNAYGAVAASGVVLLALMPLRSTADDTADTVGLAYFEKNVRPLLAQNCYTCHSGSAGVTRGGLALDTKEGWATGGNHGPAVVPGKPATSLLMKAVSYSDPNLQMPPGGKLTADQIAALKKWIENGAQDPRVSTVQADKPRLSGLTSKAREHWAFQPIRKQAIPAVKNTTWVRTPIDAFVLSKLAAHGMKPNPPASRGALIRRAYYDLVGLPPSVDDVRTFLADKSPNAWEKVIDSLLDSAQYGERWGRHWLDTARYADTRGYTANNGRDRFEGYVYPYAWTYRDYVINSLNQDKPYNQFLLEQIAADKLPDIQPNDRRLAALGFLTVGKRFQNPDDTIDERIDTVTKATIGLTVACARCHDHKFDPIPTADYYSLHGIFSSTIEPNVRPVVEITGDSTQQSDYTQKLGDLVMRNRAAIYRILKQNLEQFQDHAEGYLMVAATPVRGTARYDTAQKYGLWPLDRNIVGNLRLAAADPVLGPFARLARIPQDQFADRAVLMLRRELNAPRQRVNALVVTALRNLRPRSLEDVAHAYGQLFAYARQSTDAYFQQRSVVGGASPNIDPTLAEVIATSMPVPSGDSLSTWEGQIDFFTARTQYKPWQQVVNLFGKAMNDLAFGAINDLQLTHPGAPGCAMVVADSPKPTDSYVYLRGQRNKKGPVVPRQFLEILSGPGRRPFTDGSGRLELAQAILSPTDPLPARVEVNRVWMYHFGQGFVSTPDDLGNQSEPPSHPELLDWLAGWFQDHNWSLKKLHRLIMLSSTYQESSATDPVFALKDPGNRLLWRSNLRRLDFEAIRDSMVMLTGKLDATMGGKPVNITDEPYSNRRSCYGFVDRNNLSDLLTQFDFADPDMANTRRISTIVPQQALFFLNSPMSVDVARQVMARPEVEQSKDTEAKVRAIYLILFQRSPKPEEVQWAAQFLAQATTLADANLAAGTQPRRSPPRPQPQRKVPRGRYTVKNDGLPVSRAPLVPWELYTQALLCSNEFVYIN